MKGSTCTSIEVVAHKGGHDGYRHVQILLLGASEKPESGWCWRFDKATALWEQSAAVVRVDVYKDVQLVCLHAVFVEGMLKGF